MSDWRFLVAAPQHYTTPADPETARSTMWMNNRGYSNFTQLGARTGSYQSLPWAPMHPRDVSRPLGYYYQ